MPLFKQFTYKKFGILPFEDSTSGEINQSVFHPYIKILFLQKGGCNTVDFNNHQLEEDALFFINTNQWYELIIQNNACCGSLLRHYLQQRLKHL
jgi:hypothetical protein